MQGTTLQLELDGVPVALVTADPTFRVALKTERSLGFRTRLRSDSPRRPRNRRVVFIPGRATHTPRISLASHARLSSLACGLYCSAFSTAPTNVSPQHRTRAVGSPTCLCRTRPARRIPERADRSGPARLAGNPASRAEASPRHAGHLRSRLSPVAAAGIPGRRAARRHARQGVGDEHSPPHQRHHAGFQHGSDLPFRKRSSRCEHRSTRTGSSALPTTRRRSRTSVLSSKTSRAWIRGFVCCSATSPGTSRRPRTALRVLERDRGSARS